MAVCAAVVVLPEVVEVPEAVPHEDVVDLVVHQGADLVQGEEASRGVVRLEEEAAEAVGSEDEDSGECDSMCLNRAQKHHGWRSGLIPKHRGANERHELLQLSFLDRSTERII